jgi:hypothetical protein
VLDIETTVPEVGSEQPMIPYLVSVKIIDYTKYWKEKTVLEDIEEDNVYKNFWGENCIMDTWTWLVTFIYEKKEFLKTQFDKKRKHADFKLITFNGNRFDLQFFLPYFLLDDTAEFIGGFEELKYISLFDGWLVCQDLCMLMPGASLKKLGNTLNAKHKKIDYDIGKIRTIQDAVADKENIIKYCQEDTNATYYVFIAFK